MTFRRFVLVTHRWLGLATGVILAVVGGTGFLLAFDWGDLAIGRYASSLHERLAFGFTGHRIVLAVTCVAILLEMGGLVLWWKRKALRVTLSKGWWRACFDLHHLVGIVCLPAMLLGAVTGVAMFVFPPVETAEWYRTQNAEWYRAFRRLHVGRFWLPLRILYVATTLGFVVQGVTGFLIWWKRKV